MTFPQRPIAFVLAATNHGTMIVNRNDYHVPEGGGGFGVGYQLFRLSACEASEVQFVVALLAYRRHYFGDGVVAIDGGANIGTHTVEWGRSMYGWGRVISFEAQEVVYYALAGNIALNNCLNVQAKLSALGEQCGELAIPRPNYYQPSSFGSLELKQRGNTEFIGQTISYENSDSVTVPLVSLDSLGLTRLDLLKLDVEGMEMEVLRGGKALIAAQRPIMLIEVLKSDVQAIQSFLHELDYETFPVGINLLAIHKSDPTLQKIQTEGKQLSLLPI